MKNYLKLKLSLLQEKWHRFLCSKLGHRWDVSNDLDQPCLRKGCKVYRLLQRDRYEKMGQNPYSWKVIDLNTKLP